jgi:hypothetical protein
MEMLRRVLEHPMAHVVVADAVDGYGLEAPPAQGEDERVAVLEDARVPAVFLETRLHVAYLVLALEQRAQHQRGGGAVVLHQLTWHTLNERQMVYNGNRGSVRKRPIGFLAVLQICDILVRIRIRESIPLTNRSGSWYFRQCPSR